MNLEDKKSYFEFNPPLLKDSLIFCSECEDWSIQSEWTETGAPCEICGDHFAMACPECDHAFDHTFAEEFKTKNTQPPTNPKPTTDMNK